MKSVENGNLRSTEATLIFFSSSYALKKKRKGKKNTEQSREDLATLCLPPLLGRIAVSNALTTTTLQISL